MKADTFVGWWFGFIMGIIVGLFLYNLRIDNLCSRPLGWDWKDVDYTYTCNARKRN